MDGKVLLGEDGETVIIENMNLKDEELYKFLLEVKEEERTEVLATAIKIGYLGLKRMHFGKEIDFIEKEFKSLRSDMEKELNRMFDPSIEGSPMGELMKLLKKYFERGGTIENMFDPSNELSPLGRLRKEIIEKIENLKKEVIEEKEREKTTERTVFKGYKFEDYCEDYLSEYISYNTGDELERTSTQYGEMTGRFVGDFVITLGKHPDKKIVIEAKDWSSKLSLNKIKETLRDAMNNRGASYGILVSKYKDSLPQSVGWFNEYEGNMLVCALGMKTENGEALFPQLLNIAYQWAKLRLESEISLQEKYIPNILQGIEKIQAKLKDFGRIKNECTNIEKAAKDIREISEGLKIDILNEIKNIQNLIKEVSTESVE